MVPIKSGTRGAAHAQRGALSNILSPVLDPPMWPWPETLYTQVSRAQVKEKLKLLNLWLEYYRVLPHNRLRIFSSSSREELNEQLVRENQGLLSTSVPATQFLQERRIAPQGAVREAEACGTRANERTASILALTEPSPYESCTSPLDKRRDELERGAGGDHDLPYRFTLATSMPQVLAWVKLLVRVQQGDLQPEVVASGSGNSDAQMAYRFATRVSKQNDNTVTLVLHRAFSSQCNFLRISLWKTSITC